jgi:outer membrane protein
MRAKAPQNKMTATPLKDAFMFSRCIFISGVALLCHTFVSQGAIVLTPEKAVEMALRNSPRIHSADYGVKEAVAGKGEAFGRFFPSISANSYYKRISGVPKIFDSQELEGNLPGDLTDSIAVRAYQAVKRVIEGLSESISVGSANNYGIGLSLQQPVFSGFKLINAYRAAAIRVDMSRLARKKTEQTVAFGAVSLFWTVSFLEKSIALAVGAELRVETIAKDLESKSRQNLVPEYELLQARAAHALARVAVVNARLRFEEGKRKLSDYLAIDDEENIEFAAQADDSALMKDCGDLREFLRSVREVRPDLLLLDRESEVAALDRKILEADRLPNVGVTGEIAYARPNSLVSLSDEWKYSWSVQVLATWSVFDWGASHHKDKQAHYRLKSLDDARRASYREIISQAKTAWETVGACRAQLTALKQATAASECNYRAMTLQLQQNAASVSDLLSAQLELSQARFSEESERIQLIIALENMKIGGLGAPKS